MKLPNKKYKIIYADPPWKYDFARQVINNPTQKLRFGKVESQYPTMGLEEIKNLNIPTEKDSVLFLWVTSPKLEEGLEVLNAWGFEYITSLIWDKMVKGMGYWVRSQHEIILIGRKGKVSPPRLQISSIIKSKRNGHSKKPTSVYAIIERMFPNETKLELFARNKRQGWDVWGNEIPNETQTVLK